MKNMIVSLKPKHQYTFEKRDIRSVQIIVPRILSDQYILFQSKGRLKHHFLNNMLGWWYSSYLEESPYERMTDEEKKQISSIFDDTQLKTKIFFRVNQVFSGLINDQLEYLNKGKAKIVWGKFKLIRCIISNYIRIKGIR